MLQIKRSRSTNGDAKQLLRAHVDSLPVAQQREFVAAAFQLIQARLQTADVEVSNSPLLQRQAAEGYALPAGRSSYPLHN